MRTVSIIVPITQNLDQYKFCLESTLKNCGLQGSDIELFIYYNGCGSVNEFPNLGSNHRVVSKFSTKEKKISSILNEVLIEAENEFICIMPEPVFLPKNWLLDMVCSNAEINDSGITAISSKLDGRGVLTPKMNSSDNFEYVYQNENNLVKGVWLFHRTIMDLIGGFDPELTFGHEYLQFAYRLSKHGLSNYYLVGVTSIDIPYHKQENYWQNKEVYHESILFLGKRNNYFYKIIPTPKSVETVRPLLPELMEKFGSDTTEFYLELSESWGFDVVGFSQEETQHLDKFCLEHNQQYIVLPPKTIARGVSINFYDK